MRVVCPRCNGDKQVIRGTIIEGMALTKKCPECKGEGTVKTKEEAGHSHFNPTELRK